MEGPIRWGSAGSRRRAELPEGTHSGCGITIQMKEKKDLGRVVRAQRESMGMSVRELASLVGVSYGYISRVEIRGEKPGPECVLRIADALGLHRDELLSLAGHVAPDVKRIILDHPVTASNLVRDAFGPPVPAPGKKSQV